MRLLRGAGWPRNDFLAGTVERDYNLSEDQANALRGVRIVSCKGGTRAVAEPSRPGDEKKKRGTKNWFSL